MTFTAGQRILSTYLNQLNLIQNQAVAVATASVTFSAIPLSTALMVRWGARGTAVATGVQLYVQLNGDTGANYLWQGNQANNTSAVSGTCGTTAVNQMQMGTIPAASATAGYWGSGLFTIEGAGQSATTTTLSGYSTAFSVVTNGWVGVWGGLHGTLGVVSTITLFPASNNFAVGTEFSLYGMA